MRKKITRLLLKIGVFVIVPLICVELIMVFLDPVLFKGFYQYDPEIGFRVRPYSINVDGTVSNQFGFNDRDYPLDKQAGTFRALVVGDSFGWAGGREGNYTALLERQLEEHYGAHKIDIINTGYPMTHTGEQLQILKRYGLQYKPDLVILGFFVGNDFIDADPNRKRIVVDGLYVDIDRRKEHTLFGYPVIFRSRLLLFLQQQYIISSEMREARQEQEKTGQPALFSEATYLTVEKTRMNFFRKDQRARFQPNIDNIFDKLTAMSELLKSRHIDFMVAIYPDEFQCNERLQKSIFDTYKLNSSDYDLDFAQNLVKSLLQQKQIPFIDLTDTFTTESKKQDLYLLRNTHWNDAGNQLAARSLSPEVIKWVDERDKAK